MAAVRPSLFISKIDRDDDASSADSTDDEADAEDGEYETQKSAGGRKSSLMADMQGFGMLQMMSGIVGAKRFSLAVDATREAMLARDEKLLEVDEDGSDSTGLVGQQFFSDMSKMGSVMFDAAKERRKEVMTTLIVFAWVIGSQNSHNFLCKLIWGTRSGDDAPEIFSAIAFAQFLCSVVYALTGFVMFSNDLSAYKKMVFSWKYFWISVPYTIGYTTSYWFWIEGNRFISISTGNAVIQARMFLDMACGYIILSKPVPQCKFLFVSAVFMAVINHIFTIKADAASLDPMRGVMMYVIFSLQTAVVYCYFPLLVPKYQLSSLILSLWSSIQCVVVNAILSAWVFDWDWTALGTGYRASDMGMFTAWIGIDSACFFCPILCSPLTLTLLMSLSIPILHILELWYFGLQFSLPTFISAMAVVTTVCNVGIFDEETRVRGVKLLEAGGRK